jgi:hypothetical protein
MTQAELPPLSEWKSILLRLTAFPSPNDSSFDGESWWEKVTGYAPDTKTEQSKATEKIHQGTFEDGILTLSLSPLRINCEYAAASEQFLTKEDFPVLGSFVEQVKNFESMMKLWLKDESPTLARLAFGAQVIQTVPSHTEAYKKLSTYLPFEVDINSSDFLYRVNRKRLSKLSVADLEVNRLSTWSALRFQGNIRSSASPRQSRALERYACFLELDINTSPDYEGDLKPDMLSDLFSELITLGLEIAEKGDVA